MTMLERAARALARRAGLVLQVPADEFADEAWSDYVDDARDVFQALSEPDEEILRAMDHALVDGIRGSDDLLAAWQAALKHILEGK